jgi:glutamate-1-semialdehyde 2,1-aminomutase
MAAGLATLELIEKPGFYEALGTKTEKLMAGLQKAADQAGVAFTTNVVGGMFGLFFSAKDSVTSFADVMQCDQGRFKRFFHAMLAEGVYLAPSAFEAGFVSAAHQEQELNATIEKAALCFKAL